MTATARIERFNDSAPHLVPNRVTPGKRECAEKGCSTVLSRYNSSDYCSVHGADVKWRR